MRIVNNIKQEKELSVWSWKRKLGLVRSTAPTQEQLRIIEDVAEYCCEQLHIGYGYNIVLGYDSAHEYSNCNAHYTSTTRTVWLNMANRDASDLDQLVDDVAHELLHAYQHRYDPTVFDGYIDANVDMDGYYKHTSEVQAREYAAYVAKLFKQHNYTKPMMMAI